MGCFEKIIRVGENKKLNSLEFLNLSQSAHLWGALKKS
jgi:hypothetical protein